MLGRKCFQFLLLVLYVEGQNTNKKLNTNELKEAIGQFSRNLYFRMTVNRPGNFVFSPISIHSTISALLLGSTPNSQTYNELALVLGYLASPAVLSSSYKALINHFAADNSFTFRNKIWVNNNFQLERDFSKETEEYFGMDIDNLNFGDTRAASDTINTWVRKTTHGLINSVVEEVGPDTELFLANALYFNQSWDSEFRDFDSYGNYLDLEEFTTLQAKTIQVPMIQSTHVNISMSEIRTANGNYPHQMIKIPYKNKDYAMRIILPHKNYSYEGLHVLEEQLELQLNMDQDAVEGGQIKEFNIFKFAQTPEKEIKIRLQMPKIKLLTNENLRPVLEQMELRRIFSEGAELSRLAKQSNIRVGQVRHSAFIRVDEKGTEAAAATGVDIALLSAGATLKDEALIVDRPYIFMVTDEVNGVPLIVGRVTDPRQI